MKSAAYRLIIIGLVLPAVLLTVYLLKGAHSSPSLAIFAAFIVSPFSLIFLVLGAIRLIRAHEAEAQAQKQAHRSNKRL